MTPVATKRLPPLDAPPDFPLELRLAGSPQPLVCDSLLRYLPGKRWVCGGFWDGKPVVAKIFLDPRRGKRHWLRERRGARLLVKRGIPTARLLCAERVPEIRGYTTVFERVEGISGTEIWQSATDAAGRRRFLSSVVALLVDLHRVGLAQQDPHLENLRSVGGVLWVLDASTIVARNGPLEPRLALDNLALQLVEFLGSRDCEVDALYRLYCSRRRLDPDRYAPLFGRLYRRQHRYHLRKNVAKAFRTCSAFVAHGDLRVRWVYDRIFDTAELRSFLQDPERHVEGVDAEIVKDGNSATVWRVPMAGGDVAVKRYNIKNPTHGLRRAVSRSRAARSWEGAQRLRLLGISTPRPVAFLEERKGALRGRAWLVTEWVAGKSAGDYFATESEDHAPDPREAARLVELIDRLGREGILHGDLKASNFLMGAGGPVVIDLDAIRTRRSARDWRLGRRRDLERFRRNWSAPVWSRFFAQPFDDLPQ